MKNGSQPCPPSRGSQRGRGRRITGNADELGRMKREEESWGNDDRHLFCWWGMCVCVVLLAGGWRPFPLVPGCIGSSQRCQWRPGGPGGWWTLLAWWNVGGWNPAGGIPLQSMWQSPDVHAGAAFSWEEPPGPGHVYPWGQVQLPVLLLCFCFQTQVSATWFILAAIRWASVIPSVRWV